MPNNATATLVKQIIWVCCQCKQYSTVFGHVQCISCQHVFSEDCCTQDKVYIDPTV